MLTKLLNKVRGRLGMPIKYKSETSKVRHLVLNYCNGYGCDVGFGGDKVKKQNCVGIDYAQPYAFTGNDKVDVPCDVINDPIPIADNTYDYVYTSHLIEDFVDTKNGLEKFIRVLKSGGNLILVFPDQQVYEEYCKKAGQSPNEHHVHKNMGLNFMLNVLNEIPYIKYELLFQSNCEIDYNVVMVLKINKQA